MSSLDDILDHRPVRLADLHLVDDHIRRSVEMLTTASESLWNQRYAVDGMNAMVDAAEREASLRLLLDSKAFWMRW